MHISSFLTQHVQVGMKFHALFATVDIVHSSRLEGTEAELTRTKQALREFIDQLISESPLAIMSWSGDGGLIIGDGRTSIDLIVSWADRVVTLLPLFNRSRGRYNHLRSDFIHLRLVCHRDFITNTGDPATIQSDGLNALAKSERDVGVVDHVVVTHPVYQDLSEDLQGRFTQTPAPSAFLGPCYALDLPTSIAALQANDVSSDLVRNWIASSVLRKRYDKISIFAYTNETLYEFLGAPLPGVEIRVLARSWLREAEDEYRHNQRLMQVASAWRETKDFLKPWAKSRLIRSQAETLMDQSAKRPFQNNIDLRFYDGPPWLKGAILKSSESGRRAAYLGFYRYEHRPGRAHEGTPYSGTGMSGIWLSDDAGPKSALMDAAESRFEELWRKGSTYESLRDAEHQDPALALSCLQKIWSLDGKPYLILYPGREVANRTFPHINTEDLMACLTIEKFLLRFGASVRLRALMPYESTDDILSDWPGHAVLVCYRTLSARILKHLASEGFPFAITFKTTHQADQSIDTPCINLAGAGEVLHSPMDDAPSLPEDYCVLGRSSLPERDGSLFVISGLHGLGTWGGSAYLTTIGYLHQLCELIQEHRFATVVKCTFQAPHELADVRPVFSPIAY